MHSFLYKYKFNLIKILFLVLCFFSFSMLSAQGKKISVSGNNVPIKEIFTQIESQTKYSFAYINSKFNTNQKVSISAKNTSLSVILNQILSGTGYSYIIRKNHVFLSPVKVEGKRDDVILLQPRIDEFTTVEDEVVKTDDGSFEASLVSEVRGTLPQYSPKDSLDTNKAIGLINDLADRKRIESTTPKWAIKSNLLFDLTGSISLGTEFKIGKRYSFDLSMSYNPWEFDVSRNMKHILVQPEIRYWLCEPFNGSFWGLHTLYSHYNLSGLPFSSYMKDNRLQGDLYGIGLSYGYQWSLSNRWSLEGNLGVGYVHASYDQYACKNCKDYIGQKTKNYFSPTKLSLSIVYFIK